MVRHVEHNNKVHRLGCYDDVLQAAFAYDVAALRLHGEHAVTNYPASAYGQAPHQAA
jgi:hypothetical protein